MRNFYFLGIIAMLFCMTACRQTEKQLSSDAKILSFSFDTSIEANSIVSSQPVIQEETIRFSVTSDATDAMLSALVPTITVSENATVSPASGQSADFSGGSVTYTVTAQDGVTTTEYTAIAERQGNGGNEEDDNTPGEPANVPDEILGTYTGSLTINAFGTALPSSSTEAEIARASDTSIKLTLYGFAAEDYSFGIEDIVIEDCPLTQGEDSGSYAFSGHVEIEFSMGPMVIEATGTIGNGSIEISVSIPAFSTTGTFTGTKA